MKFFTNYDDNGIMTDVQVDKWDDEAEIDTMVFDIAYPEYLFISDGFLYIRANKQKAEYKLLGVSEHLTRWQLIRISDD